MTSVATHLYESVCRLGNTRLLREQRRGSCDFIDTDVVSCWQLNDLSELKMSEGYTLTLPVGAYGGEQADLNGLLLQHCVVPTYQFIIQIAPDQVIFYPLVAGHPYVGNILIWSIRA